jgi:aminobenzoyl-glutamate utilization protein B
VAEAMHKNIQTVGLPQWTGDDQAFAKAVQKLIGAEQKGLSVKVAEMRDPLPPERRTGGGSDDIGDVSWTVPTVTLRYPANIPGPPGHNWADSIAMATPIAHKGVTAGAKVIALTALDLLLDPALVKSAGDYFRNVQTKDVQYKPLLRPEDKPALWINRKIMGEHREQMRKFYYDASKYDTYLEQLGVKYPALEKK